VAEVSVKALKKQLYKHRLAAFASRYDNEMIAIGSPAGLKYIVRDADAEFSRDVVR
jgi:hypothetical protein